MRLVVNPERIVIAEARRTYTYLSLFGYRVDAVVANRLLPDAVADPWFEHWKRLHVEHLKSIVDGFAPLPVLKVDLAPDKLVGLDALRGFGAQVYGDLDPAAILHEGQPLRIHRRSGKTTLSLDLPFADRDDLELGRRGDELLGARGAVPAGRHPARLAAGPARGRCQPQGWHPEGRLRRERRPCPLMSAMTSPMVSSTSRPRPRR